MSGPSVLMVATIHRTLEYFLRPLALDLRSRGWKVDGMAAGAGSSPICRSAFDQVWDVAWSRSPWDHHNALAVGQVRRIVARGSYDLVHVHTPIASFATRLALRTLPTRPVLVYTTHGFHFMEGSRHPMAAAWRTLERLAGPWTDHLVVLTEEDRRQALRIGIVDERRIQYMEGIGLDLGRYRPDQVTEADVEAVRHELGLRPSDRLFTMMARFDANKRHRDVFDALVLLGRQDVHLALLGDGPQLTRTRALVDRLGLGDRVHFLGFRPEVRPLISAATALLLVSRREGLPRSVMEAMAMGTPVIGSDTRGIRDLLADGRGLLVPVGAPSQLAQAMSDVMSDPDAAGRRAAAASAYTTKLDLARIIALHEQCYRDLLSARRGAPDSGGRSCGW